MYKDIILDADTGSGPRARCVEEYKRRVEGNKAFNAFLKCYKDSLIN